MNFKLITKALQLFSTLTPDDLDLALKLHQMSDTEREGLLIALGPQKPAAKKSTERVIEHCAACDYTRRAKVHKDATAVGYHEFQPSSKKPAGKGGGGDRCGHVYGSGVTCNLMPAATVHVSTNHIDHHPFQSSKKPSKSARGGSIKSQLSNRRQGPQSITLCAYVSDDGDDPAQCGEPESSGIHDSTMGYRNYHQFQPPATHAATGD